MNPLSHTERLLARRLARRTARALVAVCLNIPVPTTRKSYLEGLTQEGLRF
jgi:hypothetical protein